MMSFSNAYSYCFLNLPTLVLTFKWQVDIALLRSRAKNSSNCIGQLIYFSLYFQLCKRHSFVVIGNYHFQQKKSKRITNLKNNI